MIKRFPPNSLFFSSPDADVEIDVVSDEEREWTDLIKAYLLLIQSTLTHSLSSSLLSNVPATAAVMFMGTEKPIH